MDIEFVEQPVAASDIQGLRACVGQGPAVRNELVIFQLQREGAVDGSVCTIPLGFRWRSKKFMIRR